MSFAVLDAAGLQPEPLPLADQILMFGMPFAATRTTSQRIFLLRWHQQYCDGEKSLKPRSV
jgi:hypothetical protein